MWHSKGVSKPKLGLSAEQVRDRFAQFPGQKCTIFGSGINVEDPAVHMLRKAGEYGLSSNPEQLFTGNNSGWQVVQIAAMSGGSPIVLIGYDAREPLSGAPSHWHGYHPRREPVAVFKQYRESFAQGAKAIKAAGVRVINASPGSAINAFEKMDLEAALS